MRWRFQQPVRAQAETPLLPRGGCPSSCRPTATSCRTWAVAAPGSRWRPHASASWRWRFVALGEGGAGVRDLSLHILDLIENAIRAEASVVSVTVVEDVRQDTLAIVVEDNGPGLAVPGEAAADPFYTTKPGKPTGLGLSLFRAAAERAGGWLTVGRSALGGACISATMQLGHVDRTPLGDLAATFSAVVCTEPHIDLRLRLCVGDRVCVVQTTDVVNELPVRDRCGIAVARRFRERINAGMQAVEAVV